MGSEANRSDVTPLRQHVLRVGPHALRVLSGGTGARLVLMLSSPVVHAGVYAPTARAFCRYGRVAVVDLPGAGWSSRVAEPLSTDALAALLPDLLAALGERSCVLVGHSNSGLVALQAALCHPQCVSALVLADSSGAHPSWSLARLAFGRFIDALIELRLTLLGWPALALNLVRHTAGFIKQVRQAPGDASLATAMRVQVPTVVAWGRRDHTMPMQAALRFQQALPDGRLTVSDSGSHDWLITQPQRFVDAVLAAIEGPPQREHDADSASAG
jgi:pimeloyl-ACP methyl ester carboxylesterase